MGESIDDRKLIGRLAPQDDWGPYVGFWATTYEMQPEFFETDFLPTVLNLGAWDDATGPAVWPWRENLQVWRRPL